jgi:hypothetical protein
MGGTTTANGIPFGKIIRWPLVMTKKYLSDGELRGRGLFLTSSIQFTQHSQQFYSLLFATFLMAYSTCIANLHPITFTSGYSNAYLDLDVGLTSADKAAINETFDALVGHCWGTIAQPSPKVGTSISVLTQSNCTGLLNQDGSFATTVEKEISTPFLTPGNSCACPTNPYACPPHYVPEAAIQHRCTTLLNWDNPFNAVAASERHTSVPAPSQCMSLSCFALTNQMLTDN